MVLHGMCHCVVHTAVGGCAHGQARAHTRNKAHCVRVPTWYGLRHCCVSQKNEKQRPRAAATRRLLALTTHARTHAHSWLCVHLRVCVSVCVCAAQPGVRAAVDIRRRLVSRCALATRGSSC